MEGWIIWLIIAVLAFVFEALTAGLTSVWFGLGTLITAILTALLDGYLGNASWFPVLQVVTFVVTSAVFLVLTKPITKKLLKTGETNALSIIGKQAVVLEDINNIEGTGQIKLNGNIWTARSVSGEVIEKGEMVTVSEIAGVSAIVKRIIPTNARAIPIEQIKTYFQAASIEVFVFEK